MGLGFSMVLLIDGGHTVMTHTVLSSVNQSTAHLKQESLPFTLLSDRMVLDVVQVRNT